jgi:hypothetical protein
MTTTYNLKNIRILLTEGFSAEELRRFCYYDELDFRPVYHQLTAYTRKSDIIDLLMEYAEQKRLVEPLLIWAKASNPARYEEHQPYDEIISSPSEFQEAWKIQTSLKLEHLFASPDYLCLVTKEAIHFLSPSDGKPLLPPLTTIENLALVDYPITGGVVTPFGNLLLTLLPPDVSGKASLWSLNFVGQSGQSPGIFCQCLYEAPSAQLSAPVMDNGFICLIQRGPELVILDPAGDKVYRTLPLPKLDNIHRDCVSFTFAANQLCLALCDGSIFALDAQTGQILRTLRERDGHVLSSLTTDGLHLFFGASLGRKGLIPSRVYAMNAALGQPLWDFEMPPDPSGLHRSIDGQILMVNDKLYVTGRNHYLYALDSSTGQELWRYEMPGGIKLGPVWAGEAVIIADRQGNIHALRIDRPVFVVTCHYDLKTPPVLNEWNPLIFMLNNTSNDLVRNIILRLSGDFQGKTEHHTQRFYTILPNSFERCSIELKPTAAGATVHLEVIIDYQLNNLDRSEKLDLSVPVRRSNLAPAVIRETGISPDGRWQYNYLALRALLMAALTNAELSHICFLHFHAIQDSLKAGTDKRMKINELIEYVEHHQQVEQLLIVVQQCHPVRYEQYIQEIKHEIGYSE